MNTYNTILEGLESGDLEFKFFDEVYYKQDNRWKRRRKTYEEQVAEYTAAAEAAAQVKLNEAEAAKQAALEAATASEAAAATAIESFVGDAPANLDSIAEIASYITKSDIMVSSLGNGAMLPLQLTANESNKIIKCTNTSAISLQMPDDVPIGTEIAFVKCGSGDVGFTNSGNHTLYGPKFDDYGGVGMYTPKIKEMYGSCSAVKVDASTWVLAGNLE